MKNPFRRVRYTVVMIPEAGQRVVRFRMPRMALFVVPLLVVVLAVTLYVLKDSYDQSLTLLQSLEKRLSIKESELSTTIAAKNREIERLQHDIVSLSEEAETVRLKVESLKQLEQELRGLTGDGGDGGGVTVASASGGAAATEGEDMPPADAYRISALSMPTDAAQTAPPRTSHHMGGRLLPVESGQIEILVTATSSELEALAEEMDQLSASLVEAREEYLSYQHMLRITPSIWPVASREVTSRFGYRKDPFTGRLSAHTGIDIAGRTGSTVVATADGTVSYVGYDRSSGYHVIIDHGAGIQTQYMHLSKYTVKKGQNVKRNDEIGKLGSTGRSTGPHLHYEVIKNGQTVDPSSYMN